MTAGRQLYLGGPSAEIPRVLEAADVARALGWEITAPWWLRVQEAGRLFGARSDADVPDHYMAESARLNERGLRIAERVAFLCRAGGGLSGGCAYELGLAKWLSDYDGIYIVGDPRRFVGVWEPPRTANLRIVSSIEEALR